MTKMKNKENIEEFELEEIPCGLAKSKRVTIKLTKENKDILCPKTKTISLKKIM